MLTIAEIILPHAGNKRIWMLGGENRVKKPATQDTSGLSRQCFATEPQQPDNHQPSQPSMCTAQVHCL